MTNLLEKAFSKANLLPDEQQDEIAMLLPEQLGADQKWDELFAQKSEQLLKLADKAWADHEAGKSEPLGPDTL